MELFIVLLILAISDAQTILNPCRVYTNITDRARDINNQPRQTDTLLCDEFQAAAWFRFVNGLMPTSCQQPFRCGTQAPIWLKGSVPQVSEGVVDRIACANTQPDDVGPNACCATQIPIQIRNCGGFVVYYLRRPPACPMAYCTESPPRLLSPPQLTGPEVINRSFRFGCNISFQRGVPNIAFNVTWFFDGVPIPGTAATLTGDQRIAFIDENVWTGNMGKTLRCRVETFYTTVPSVRNEPEDSNGYWGGIVTTPSTLIISEAEGSRQVNVTSTLPILCDRDPQCNIRINIDVVGESWQDIATLDRCALVLSTRDWDAVTRTATASTAVMATRDVVLDGDQRLQIHFNAVLTTAPNIWRGLNIPSVSVYTVDRETRRCLAFGDPHIRGLERERVIHLYEAGDYVMVRSTTRAFEVNIRTFPCAGLSCICAVAIQDGNDVLSINICSNDWCAPPAQVRVLSGQPLSPGTTIQRSRDGRNFMISFASGSWLRVRDLQQFLNVEVQVPAIDFGHTLGLCGTFDGNPSNEFTGPDGRVFPDNTDFPVEFFASWRLNAESSLINGVVRPPPTNRLRAQVTTTTQCLCRTTTTTLDCGQNRAIQDPARLPCPQCTDITTTLREPQNNTFRLIDDVDDHHTPEVVATRTQIKFNFTVTLNSNILGVRPQNNLPGRPTPTPWTVPPTLLPPTFNTPRLNVANVPLNIPLYVPGFPTGTPRTVTRAPATAFPSVRPRPALVTPTRNRPLTPQRFEPIITGDMANKVCMEAMMNFTIGRRCIGLVGFHIHAYVNACVTDMLAAQSNFFLQAAVSAMESGCQEVVFRNVTNYRRDRQGARLPPPEVTSFMCPNQCSLRGVCIQGNCVCDRQYTSDDCSVEINRPPIILRILRNGVCDARMRTCLMAFLQVENVMKTPNISCRVRDVRITNGQMNPGSVFVRVNADFHGAQEVACDLPDPRVPEDIGYRGYLISLTIDGVVFSNEILYMVFDSACLVCTRQGSCGIRDGMCFIEDQCRRDREEHPTDSSLVCDVSRSQDEWTLTVTAVATRAIVPFCERNSLFDRWDIWTSNRTGCQCAFDATRTDCACCERGGCQCSQPNQNQCALCGQEAAQCGRRQPPPQFGIDGWTRSLTGCPCVFNRSRTDCACCQNNGCQCTVEHRNQCSPCELPEVCGSKPDVFGALRTEF